MAKTLAGLSWLARMRVGSIHRAQSLGRLKSRSSLRDVYASSLDVPQTDVLRLAKLSQLGVREDEVRN